MGDQAEFRIAAGKSGVEVEDLLLVPIRRAATSVTGRSTVGSRVFRGAYRVTPRWGDSAGCEIRVDVTMHVASTHVTARAVVGETTLVASGRDCRHTLQALVKGVLELLDL